jgi:hypothetical protein
LSGTADKTLGEPPNRTVWFTTKQRPGETRCFHGMPLFGCAIEKPNCIFGISVRYRGAQMRPTALYPFGDQAG